MRRPRATPWRSLVFDNLSADGADPALGPAPTAALAGRMHAAWIAPARSGDPRWRAFDDTYPVMIFDAAGGGVRADRRAGDRVICRHSGGARRALARCGWAPRRMPASVHGAVHVTRPGRPRHRSAGPA